MQSADSGHQSTQPHFFRLTEKYLPRTHEGLKTRKKKFRAQAAQASALRVSGFACPVNFFCLTGVFS
jgi:hypothetical protein